MRNQFITAILFLVFIMPPVFAQPGGGGGLQVFDIYRQGNLVRNTDTVLQVRHFLLSSKKLKVVKKITEQVKASYYRYAEQVSTHFYLPPYIMRGEKRQAAPNQRLELIYESDTMVIDIIGIIPENGAGYTDKMEKIEFMPGHFRCYRNPLETVPLLWNDPSTNWEQKSSILKLLQEGITANAVNKLIKIGLIIYTPAQPAQLVKKHIAATQSDCTEQADTITGYSVLRFDNINIKDSITNIATRVAVSVNDSVSCYKFFYSYVFDKRNIAKQQQLAWKDL